MSGHLRTPARGQAVGDSGRPVAGWATYEGSTYPLKPRLSKSSYLEGLPRFVVCQTTFFSQDPGLALSLRTSQGSPLPGPGLFFCLYLRTIYL